MTESERILAATLTRLPNGAYQDTTDPGEPSGGKRVSVTEEEGGILRALAARKRVLEIGTGLGVSTAYMAETAEMVWTVDVDQWAYDRACKQFELAQRIRCFRSLDGIAGVFDMAFIDGAHDPASVEADIRAVRSRILFRGGLIVLHDIKFENVARGAANAGVKWIPLKTEHGLGLVFV